VTSRILTSVNNPLIKQIRKLHRNKERHRQNLLLLEGTNLLEAACQANYKLTTICYTRQWQERHPQLWQRLALQAKQIELVSPEVLGAIATTVNPDGVVAMAPRQAAKTPVISEIKLGLAIERLQDPGNLGTIIRSAVAVGVDGLWLSRDSVDLDHPKVLRASVGEWFRLPMAVSQDLATLVKDCQQQGIQVIATLAQAQQTYWNINFQCPTLILLGNEGSGLSEKLIALSDHQVKIPLSGGVESLNVAIAAALIVYEAQRQFYQT
jgi:TrmH family RNA methyltransferase